MWTRFNVYITICVIGQLNFVKFDSTRLFDIFFVKTKEKWISFNFKKDFCSLFSSVFSSLYILFLCSRTRKRLTAVLIVLPNKQKIDKIDFLKQLFVLFFDRQKKIVNWNYWALCESRFSFHHCINFFTRENGKLHFQIFLQNTSKKFQIIEKIYIFFCSATIRN